MKKRNHAKEDFRKLVIAIRKEDLFTAYLLGGARSEMRFFFAAERIANPTPKPSLTDRLFLYKHGCYTCDSRRYA